MKIVDTNILDYAINKDTPLHVKAIKSYNCGIQPFR
jgi:hypothetical protein